MKEISGSKSAGEKFVPHTAILHPVSSTPPASETEQFNDYIRNRYGSRE
jgi:hypothetical protein